MNCGLNYSESNLNAGLEVESSEILYIPVEETRSFNHSIIEKVKSLKEKASFTERGTIISGGSFAASFISSVLVMSLEINHVIAPNPIYATAAICSMVFSLTSTAGFIYLNMKYSKELEVLGS